MLLTFGCASERQFFYREELELRQWWMPELRVIMSADQVDTVESDLIQGTPIAALGDQRFNPDTSAYICGPPPMIEAARRHLRESGVAADLIYAEQFVASALEKPH